MALQRASVERPLANAVAEQAKVSEGKLAEFAKELLREEDKVVEALHAQLHRAEAGGGGQRCGEQGAPASSAVGYCCTVSVAPPPCASGLYLARVIDRDRHARLDVLCS